MEEGKKGGILNKDLEWHQSSGSESKTQATQKTQTQAHRSARTLVRCITQHITYPQVVKVGGHLLPCLNFMHKICMHNKPCQMLTGDGLTALIFLERAAGHFPRLPVRKSSNCEGKHSNSPIYILHHWAIKKEPRGCGRASLRNWFLVWVLICPGVGH